ncbi:MAG: transcriptional regulator domain-containing protein [Pikeienuella sp.]|uniref:transcriptional regulator domain-containing protein n=1 Tax=Pikeienuella sp. TaxID=2831957 RepID=UPI00391B73A4
MTRDWRDDHAYDVFDRLDLSGLAWECLRRNSRYRKEYPLLGRGLASPAGWGLRFPG